ncbi:MAG TPA: hypothetical protein ENH10_01640 [Bacteroidetes bacterium]|nr:hypothetical protein [Bacteroidota bacterium]HEX03849.1 hypothetical protein [Bacteroidota bacterium]
MAESKKIEKDLAINPTRMKPAEYIRTVYSACIEHGITKEDILQPKFWAHFAMNLKPNDRIEAFAEDGTFYAELLVVACDRTWAKMHLMSYHDLTKVDMNFGDDVMDQYSIVFKGPKKWCVIRKSDNAILNDKMLSEGDGKKWLDVFLRKRAA